MRSKNAWILALMRALGLSAAVKMREQRGDPPAGSSLIDAEDPGAALRAAQQEDGSFGGDVARTGAALLSWALLGQSAQDESVARARRWLESQPDALAELAIQAAANPGARDPRWRALCIRGPEGRLLARLLV